VCDLPTFDELRAITRCHGIEHLGVAPAAVMDRARHILLERRAAGLHDEMQFTYRNPERSTDPQQTVAGARSIIVAARSYLIDAFDADQAVQAVQADQAEAAAEGGGECSRSGRVARYAWVDHYGALRAGLEEIADALRAAGHQARVLADDNAMVDREVAHLAGLGWFGKNANLLIGGAGSYFVLGSVVTTADYLDEMTPPVPDGCGSCGRCLDACPTAAIVAPGVVDARRCLAWLVQRRGSFPLEFRSALGDRIYGCDDCQEVCPPTVRLGERHRLPTSSDDAVVERRVDLVGLLEASDEILLARHHRWYIADRDPRWLRRNALVVLGNIGHSRDSEVIAVLERYGADSDPLLAEHARWALEQIAARDDIDDRRNPGGEP
jgi:epoxyqueuosine reductase